MRRPNLCGSSSSVVGPDDTKQAKPQPVVPPNNSPGKTHKESSRLSLMKRMLGGGSKKKENCVVGVPPQGQALRRQFASPLAELPLAKGLVPKVLHRICTYLESYGMSTSGLFKGSAREEEAARRLRGQLERDGDACLEEVEDPRQVAALLKLWLADLPQPLLSAQATNHLIALTSQCGVEGWGEEEASEGCGTLPWQCLRLVLRLLHTYTRRFPPAMAYLPPQFAPLLAPPDSPPSQTAHLIALLIDNYNYVFDNMVNSKENAVVNGNNDSNNLKQAALIISEIAQTQKPRKRKERHDSISKNDPKFVRSNSEERPVAKVGCGGEMVSESGSVVAGIRRVSSHEDFSKGPRPHIKVHTPNNQVRKIGVLPLHERNTRSPEPCERAGEKDEGWAWAHASEDDENEHEARRHSERLARPPAPQHSRHRPRLRTRLHRPARPHHNHIIEDVKAEEVPLPVEDTMGEKDEKLKVEPMQESQIDSSPEEELRQTDQAHFSNKQTSWSSEHLAQADEPLRDDQSRFALKKDENQEESGVQSSEPVWQNEASGVMGEEEPVRWVAEVETGAVRWQGDAPQAWQTEPSMESSLWQGEEELMGPDDPVEVSPGTSSSEHSLQLDFQQAEDVDKCPSPISGIYSPTLDLKAKQEQVSSEPLSSTAMWSSLPPSDERMVSPRNSLVLSRRLCAPPCTTTADHLTILDLSAQIHGLKQKLKKYEEGFEREFGFKPSQADKAANSDIRKMISLLNKLRKQAKLKKEEMRISNLEKSSSRSPVLTEEVVKDIESRLKGERHTGGRCEEVDDMSHKELVEEKASMQRALLALEATFGRPQSRDERDVVRPLYDRYRHLKRTLLKHTPSKMKESVSELGTILEHEAMDFGGGGGSPGSPRSPSPPQVLPRASSPTPPPDRKAISLQVSLDNLHALPAEQLLELQKSTREEKKRLKRSLREQESEARRAGVRLEHSPSTQLGHLYADYKQAKAKLKFIDALVNKLK